MESLSVTRSRVAQLQRLIDESFGGSKTALCTRVGMSTSQIGQYLSGYRSLGEKAARKIESGAGKPNGWLDSSPLNVALAPIGARCIPLINYVQAGMWAEICDGFQADQYLLTHLDLSKNAFALEVRGDSMQPDFRPGDHIIVDPAITPNPGDFVVAKNGDDEATFKKYRLRGISDGGQQIIELVPLNPDFATIRSDITPFRIVGTLVEHRRFLLRRK